MTAGGSFASFPEMAATFTDDELRRYARHIILPEIGGIGQARLREARVLVVGAGGLGSPLLLYLAAAGVGTLGIVDDDTVDLTNLQRQVIHGTSAIGQPKVDSAAETIARINPGTTVIRHRHRLNAGNAPDLIAGYRIVADGSDNFETRFLVNDACYLADVPLVSGAILRFDGQVATFRRHDRDGNRTPCYRCLYGHPPGADAAPSCAEAGVMGAFCGVVGSLQATEVIKEILGIGDSLAGWLLLADALSGTFRRIRVPPDPGCPLCGDAPSIVDLGGHDGD